MLIFTNHTLGLGRGRRDNADRPPKRTTQRPSGMTNGPKKRGDLPRISFERNGATRGKVTISLTVHG